MSFQPICVLCLSDCDRGGGVTSCNHYLCSRCVARLPTAAPCPLCQQPYQLVKLDNPNVQQLLQDGTTALQRMSKVTGSQLRHYQQIVARMRQALSMLHDQHQDMAHRRQRKEAECAAAVSQVQGLQAEVCRLREELAHATASKAATIRASSQRTASHPQAPPQSPPHQLPPRAFVDARATHASREHHREPSRTIEICQTPSGQMIPSSSVIHRAPFLPTAAVGGKAPHLSPHGHWPRVSAVPSPSSASNLYGQHRQHHLSAEGSDVCSAAAGDKVTPSAVVSAPPLGWSASSLIAKRHRADSDPSQARRRVDNIGASSAQPPAEFRAGASVVLTPRSHATASLQQRQPHQSSHASMRGPGGGGDFAGSGANPWLPTPQGAMLQHPHQSRRFDSLTQGAGSYISRPSSKPLQRLFSPHEGPKSL